MWRSSGKAGTVFFANFSRPPIHVKGGSPITPSVESQSENCHFVESQTRKMQIFGVYTPIFAKKSSIFRPRGISNCLFCAKKAKLWNLKTEFREIFKSGG